MVRREQRRWKINWSDGNQHLTWVGKTKLVKMITNISLHDSERLSSRSIKTSSHQDYQEKAGNLGQKTAARRGLSCLSDKVKHGDLWLSKNSRNLNGAGRKLAEYFIKGCEVTIPADWRWQERRNLREGEIPILRWRTQKHNLRLGGVSIVNRKYKNI